MNIDELSGPKLDAEVARIEGLDPEVVRGGYAPSSRWHDGGPIIERMCITISVNSLRDASDRFREFWAFCPTEVADAGEYGRKFVRPLYNAIGETHLLAAMRAYVKSKVAA